MPTREPSKEATARRYSPEEKQRAVRLVRTLREGLGDDRGCAKRVADQLGYGVESVRAWARQADIHDGLTGGVTTNEAERLKALEQENRELRRANSILKSAPVFFAAELDRPQR